MLRRTIDVIITIVELTGNPLIGEATTMTTAKTKSASQECPTVPTDAFKRYIDVLLDNHEKLTAAVKGARSRTARLNDEFLESVVASQRSALEFGKKIAENPTDVASNVKAAIEIASSAQARAVDFARVLFREQADLSQELRQSFGSTFTVGKDFSESFKGFSEGFKGFGESFKAFNGYAMPWLKPLAQ